MIELIKVDLFKLTRENGLNGVTKHIINDYKKHIKTNIVEHFLH